MLLIDIERLRQQGWLAAATGGDEPRNFDVDRVDYGQVITHKWIVLRSAYTRLRSVPSRQRELFAAFCREESGWLDEFALFMAIKGRYRQRSWLEWPAELRLRDPAAIAHAAKELAPEIELHKLVQYFFYSQWRELREQANGKGVRIVGDIPIFVAMDSADVWSRPELFQLDDDRRPRVVAGVPPDYFSETGQLWGNPLYDWAVHEHEDYRWWADVFRSKLALYDWLRIDHFRGFEAYWEVAADETTAVNGRWVAGPGARFFEAVERQLGPLPAIAEDLGVITPEVVWLRERFGFPGMKILQFAFDSAEANEFRPHTYERNSVAYTGTHDNDTVLGWFTHARARDSAYALEYLNSDGSDVAWAFVRAAWASPAVAAIAPLQDILGLGSDARMNTPSTLGGNWEWRVRDSALTSGVARRLRRISEVYVRAGDPFKNAASDRE